MSERRKFKRPRAWSDPTGCSSTVVLWDPNDWSNKGLPPQIYMCTNLGWVPVGVDEEDREDTETVAEAMAKGYELEEVPRERAIWFAGHEGLEEDFE